MGWLGRQVSGQPYLPVQTKPIVTPPGEQQWITLYYYTKYYTKISLISRNFGKYVIEKPKHVFIIQMQNELGRKSVRQT